MRSERALRRSGRCCARASSRARNSPGGRFVWEVRAGKGSTSSSRSTGASTGTAATPAHPGSPTRDSGDAARRPRAAAPGGRSSSVRAAARRSSWSCWACRCWSSTRRRAILPERAVVRRARTDRCLRPDRRGESRVLPARRGHGCALHRGEPRGRHCAARRSSGGAPAFSPSSRPRSSPGACSRPRRTALADVPALAASAAVRRRRPDPRQGRRLLRLLAAVRAAGVRAAALARRGRGRLRGARVRRARGARAAAAPRNLRAQVHLACPGRRFLLVVAWRLRLEQYVLELGQASAATVQSFAGAGYVDVHVRLPGLAALAILAVVLAVACVAAPFIARARACTRGARGSLGIPVALLAVAAAARRPGLRRSSSGSSSTRIRSSANSRTWSGRSRPRGPVSGSTPIDVQPYSPTGRLHAPPTSRRSRKRVADVRSGTRGCSRRGCASWSPRRRTTARTSRRSSRAGRRDGDS